jgi:hypothetical protein
MIIRACLIVALEASVAGQVLAQEPAPPPPREAAQAPEPRRFDLSAAGEQQPVKLKRDWTAEETPLFFDWSLDGRSSWSAAHGFQMHGDGTVAPVAGLSPSWLALGPSWDFTLRASATGPGGVRFTAKGGATYGGQMPLFASPLLVGQGTAGPLNQQLDLAQRDQLWNAGVEAERIFDLGRVDLLLFGEALYLAGAKPGDQTRPPPPAVKFDKPVRVTGGVGVKF